MRLFPGILRGAGFKLKFKLIDILTISYFLVLNTLVILFRQRLPRWYIYFSAHLLYIFLITSLVWLDERLPQKNIRFIRFWYPLLSLPFVYEELGQFVHLVFPYWVDPAINKFEKEIFGVYPTVWLQGIVNPVITEYFKFAYFSYYLIFPLPAILFYMKGERDEFDEFILALFSAYYFSFIGFILFPVEGPRYALSKLYSIDLNGYFFASLQDFINRLGALHGGCMPSSHVAASLVSLIAVRRYKRGLYYFLLPIVMSLFFSTVYNRDHYFSDVVAGILVGCLGLSFPKIFGR